MYRLKFHTNLASRWSEFPPSTQLLMVASELSRAKNMTIRHDHAEATNALERAFELLDMTISRARTIGMLTELHRFREVLADLYSGGEYQAERVQKLIEVLVSLDKDSCRVLGAVAS